MFERRQIITGLIVGIATASFHRSASASDTGAGRRMPTAYPSFELQAKKSTLSSLRSGIAGFKVEAMGKSVGAVWLRGTRGQTWLVAVAQRDVRPMFEVFTLGIDSIEEVQTRWREWEAPVVPADTPEPLQQLMTTRPSEPIAPTDFQRWPFETARIDVLRRVEFVIEAVEVAGTVGEHPNSQAADRPGHVPDEASASCEVAAGLLFTGTHGARLLIGVDWMPMDLLFTQEAAAIEAYLALCEQIDLSAYSART